MSFSIINKINIAIKIRYETKGFEKYRNPENVNTRYLFRILILSSNIVLDPKINKKNIVNRQFVITSPIVELKNKKLNQSLITNIET